MLQIVPSERPKPQKTQPPSRLRRFLSYFGAVVMFFSCYKILNEPNNAGLYYSVYWGAGIAFGACLAFFPILSSIRVPDSVGTDAFIIRAVEPQKNFPDDLSICDLVYCSDEEVKSVLSNCSAEDLLKAMITLPVEVNEKISKSASESLKIKFQYNRRNPEPVPVKEIESAEARIVEVMRKTLTGIVVKDS